MPSWWHFLVVGMEAGEHESEHNENITSAEHSTDSSSNETTSIVDEANYQTAQATITQAIQNFDEIKEDSDTNSTELAESLNAVKENIDSKAPFDEIDTIVDDKITSLLNSVYDLNLSEEAEHAEGGEEEHAEGVTTSIKLIFMISNLGIFIDPLSPCCGINRGHHYEFFSHQI